MSEKKIKIAVVGCGRIFERHYKSIISLNKKYELVALCDKNSKKLKKFSYLKIPLYTNIEKLINHEKLDLVSICTPSGLHPFHTTLCARKKINVVCEKPMATSWIDAKKMTDLCIKNKVYCFVVKQNRYNPTIKLLKRLIESNRFGKIYLINVNVFWNRNNKYYKLADWRGDKKLDGGTFYNQASHYFDLIYYLFGESKNVFSLADTLNRKINTEDVGIVSIRLKSGALCTINATVLSHNTFEGSLTIIAEKGNFKIGGKALNKIEFSNFKTPSKRVFKNTDYTIKNVYGYGHLELYKNIYKDIKSQKNKLNILKSNLKSFELLAATYKSIKTKKLITLPLLK